MDVFVDSEGLFHILDSRHRRPVQELVVGKIKAVKMSVLRRHRHQPLAAHRLDQSGRVGDVPIVPIPRHELEMILVGTGLGVEDNDGAGEEIVSLADAVVEVGRGIPYRNIQESKVDDVQAAPPLIGAPGMFFQVEVSSGELPSGPRTVSPSVLGTRKNCHTIFPVLASSAYMCPLPPLKSLPALPMKTRPFHTIGAAGTLSPFVVSAIGVSQSRLPVLKS